MNKQSLNSMGLNAKLFCCGVKKVQNKMITVLLKKLKEQHYILALIYLFMMFAAFVFVYMLKGRNEFYMSALDKVIIVGCSLSGALFVLFKRKLLTAVSVVGEILIILLTPLLLFKKLEPMVNDVGNLADNAWLFNWLILLALFVVIYALTLNAGATVLIVGGFIYIFYLVDYFTVRFRGTPVLFSDILSAKTALGVAGEYTYVLTDTMVTGFYELFLFVSIGYFFTCKKGLKTRLLAGVPTLIAGIFAISLLYRSDILENMNFKNSPFLPMDSANLNGLFLNCMVNAHDSILDAPDGYSEKEVETIIEKYTMDDEKTYSDVRPNVIVVMNESFTDIDYLEVVETSEETIPFYKSLRENSLYGTLISSILGGNTPNSEFEFLTGCTMAFLPTGMVVYQQLISDDLPTVASNLREEGYDTTAIHLYNPTYFDRQRIYPLLGFNKFVNEGNYSRDDIVVDYTRAETGYADDSSSFRLIEHEYEEKEPEDRLFCFCVTIQNHGGYWTGLNDVTMTNFHNDYANEYVTLLKMTDDAFKDFIAYVEDIDEPTVVLMYGDHQPYLFADDYVNVFDGYDYTAEEERYLQSKVPFLIWANYDLDALNGTDMGEMSINYLGPTLLKSIGLPMSDYFTYLDNLRETLPVISAVGFKDKDGNYFTDAGNSEYSQMITEYKFLQYNYLKGNVGEEFYK